jgi:BirA family biotin operon repressor/biotin-[acetyl-CoA-carboxylase] ligase
MAIELNEESIRKAAKGLPIPQVIHFEEIDSTNEYALKIAGEQAQEFTLVIAERQTAGRGRLGRKWVTTPGTSLAFSLILKPKPAEIDHLGLFSLLGGLAVCKAIRKTCAVNAQVKWPNDVLLERQKTAGILAEACWQGEQLVGVVLGIGVNLMPGSVPPPDTLLFPATCVQAHCSHDVDRMDFLIAVLEQVIQLRRSILEDSFLAEYKRHLAFVGEQVRLSGRSVESVGGVLAGVDGNGQLLLQMETGEQESFPIGDLHLRPGEDNKITD